MKYKRQCMVFLICGIVSFAYIAGCKYDVAEPLWYQPYTYTVAPVIDSVFPGSVAKAGDNYIRI